MNKNPQTIYNPETQRMFSVPMESKREDIETKFIESLVEYLNEILDVNYSDRRLTSSLLKNMLSEQLNSRYKHVGLLQQYLSHELDKAMESFKNELLIPDDVKVNHSNVTHAKFSDLIRYISKNYIRVEDINSDGTFETIEEARNNQLKDSACMTEGVSRGPMTDCDEVCESPG